MKNDDKTEVIHGSFSGCKWLGYQDSREYLGDTNEDYCLKHFHTQLEDNELFLLITDETMGSKNGKGAFFSQPEGTGNWTCFTEEDRNILEGILIKNLDGFHNKQ